MPGQLGLEVLEAHPAGRSVEAEGEGGEEVIGFAWRFRHFFRANTFTKPIVAIRTVSQGNIRRSVSIA